MLSQDNKLCPQIIILRPQSSYNIKIMRPQDIMLWPQGKKEVKMSHLWSYKIHLCCVYFKCKLDKQKEYLFEKIVILL